MNITHMLGCVRDCEHGMAVKVTLAECKGAAMSTGFYRESLARVLCEIWHIKTTGNSR